MNKNELKHCLLKGQDTFLKHLSVDCVIFGFHGNQLKVLLVKWTEGWSIPGWIRSKGRVDQGSGEMSLEGTYRT